MRHRGLIRRSIRRSPGKSRHYQKSGQAECIPSRVEYINRNKTVPVSVRYWTGDLAVPETIIQAKKASLLRGERGLTIRKEDLRVYDKRAYVPIGLESNKVFLRELAGRAGGTLYVVDDLNRNSLIDIVKYEKRASALTR